MNLGWLFIYSLALCGQLMEGKIRGPDDQEPDQLFRADAGGLFAWREPDDADIKAVAQAATEQYDRLRAMDRVHLLLEVMDAQSRSTPLGVDYLLRLVVGRTSCTQRTGGAARCSLRKVELVDFLEVEALKTKDSGHLVFHFRRQR